MDDPVKINEARHRTCPQNLVRPIPQGIYSVFTYRSRQKNRKTFRARRTPSKVHSAFVIKKGAQREAEEGYEV